MSSYNSAIFGSSYRLDYAVFGVFENFLSGEPFNVTNAIDGIMINASPRTALPNSAVDTPILQDVQMRAVRGELHNCEALAITNDYPNVPVAGPLFDVKLLVHDGWNTSESVFGYGNDFNSSSNSMFFSPYWSLPLQAEQLEIEKCLGRLAPPHCGVFVNELNLVIVLTFNAIKVICMVLCLYFQNHRPLLTIGDAIATFLHEEDDFTQGCGTLSVCDFRPKFSMDHRKKDCGCFGSTRFASSSRSWLTAPNPLMWVLPILVYALP